MITNKPIQRPQTLSGAGLESWLTSPQTGRALLFVFLLVLPVLFSTNALENFEYPKALWLRACALLFLIPALILAAAHFPVGWRQAPRRLLAFLREDWLTAGVLLVLVSALLSTLTSHTPRICWWGEHPSYGGLTTIAGHAVVYFAAWFLARNILVMERLLWATLTAALLATVYAGLQFAQIDSIGWRFSSDAGQYLRPFGTLGHPNHLGTFLAMVFPVALFFLWHYRESGRWANNLALAALVLAPLAGMILSLSRAAWLGWLFAMALGLYVCARRQWEKISRRALVTWLVGGALLLLLVVWWNPRGLVSGFQDRLNNLTSGWARLHIWKASVAIFQENPVLGSGPDTFHWAFIPHRTPAFWEFEWNSAPTRAHNEVLHVLATQGLVGGAAVVIMLIGLVRAACTSLRAAHGRARDLALALVCGTIVFLIASLFTFTANGYGPVFLVFAAFLNRLASTSASEEPEGTAWFGPAFLIGAVVVFAQFAWNFSLGLTSFSSAFCLSFAAMGVGLAGMVALGLSLMKRQTPAADAASTKVSSHHPAPRWVGWGASGVVVASLLFLVVLPWVANVACAKGDALMADDPIQAKEHIELALSLDPAWDLYWIKLAHVTQQAGARATHKHERTEHYQQALKIWEHLAKRNPRTGLFHNHRGVCLAHLHREGLASATEVMAPFEMALQCDPSNPIFCADAADAAIRTGRTDVAWEYANRGLACSFRYAPLFGQVGYLCLLANNPGHAAHSLDQAAASNWDGHKDWEGAARANQIVAHSLLGNHAKVESLSSALLKDHPRLLDIRAFLAEAQEKQGKLRDAFDNYCRILAITPSHRRALEGRDRLGAAEHIRPVSWKKDTD